MKDAAWLRQGWLRGVLAAALFWVGVASTNAEQTQPRYFAHDAVKDEYGVIAPWYQGQNGQWDLRVRIAAETLKRYPWTTPEDGVQVPGYIVNGKWSIDDNGKITIIPIGHEFPPQYANFIKNPNEWQWDNCDYGGRAYYVLLGLVQYYQYSGDPVAIAHIYLQVEHLLNYTLTPQTHPWPNFPISVPVKGQGYTYYDPTSFIQLDIAAKEGLAVLRAYELTGEKRWLEAAQHWGDLLAEKRNPNPAPGVAPWGRYAVEPDPRNWDPTLTGGVASIQQFFDELLRLGYVGRDGAIKQTRDQCQQYLRDVLLPRWTLNDTWGRFYQDNEAGYQSLGVSDIACQDFMADPAFFPQWKTNVRNILSLYFNNTGVFDGSRGDTYQGAWAFPESHGCCGRSLDYSPMVMALTFAQYANFTNDPWAKELARRMTILSTYQFHENGVIEDNIDGGWIVASGWFKIAHPMPLAYVLRTMGWMPELLGANRENHIMRSSSVVRSVTYGEGAVDYETFSAPANSVDCLRLAFIPSRVKAGGQALARRDRLDQPGYTVQPLANGDCVVLIRHDGQTAISVKGHDPQQTIDDSRLQYEGSWQQVASELSTRRTLHEARIKGAMAQCRFTGNQVRLIGRVDPQGGLADVFVDGVKQRIGIDCWNPQVRERQVLYYLNGLSNAEHELKIAVRGEKNPGASGSKIYVDAVQCSDATGTVSFGSGGGSREAQRMVFGYQDRTPYTDAQGHIWLPGTEFIARTGQSTYAVDRTWWKEPLKDPLTGTPDAGLYRHGVHAPEFWVNATVAPGTYHVRIKLAATAERGIDPQRQAQTIRINGQAVATRLNVAATAGALNQGVDLVYNDIQPVDGIIEIKFTGENGTDAFVQAIEVGPGSGGTGATPVCVAPTAPPASTPTATPAAPAEKKGFIPGMEGKF